jgi:hypothetical protein
VIACQRPPPDEGNHVGRRGAPYEVVTPQSFEFDNGRYPGQGTLGSEST